MKNYKLGDMELEFANLIWENEPISSGGLVQLCEQKFSWKKSTTYTMLKRLCDKGIFQNIRAMSFLSFQSRSGLRSKVRASWKKHSTVLCHNS